MALAATSSQSASGNHHEVIGTVKEMDAALKMLDVVLKAWGQGNDPVTVCFKEWMAF